MVCRKCAQGWTGVDPGDRCPSGDGGALITSDVHHSHPSDTVLGKVIAGKYPLIDKLGEGGFGAVYRGIQEPVGRAVAVKVILPSEAQDQSLRGRFFREARVVARLSSPATVTLHDYGEDGDGTLFMVFEFIEGQLLSSLIKQERRLEQGRAIGFAIQILGALSEAHAHGLVHRDLKPENIMVTTGPIGDEKIKVLDFGIAKVLGQEGQDDVRTREGIVLGTPSYMSPEQSQDKQLDGRSDLYALGIILYEMLSGKPPFQGAIPLDVLMAHISKPVPPLDSSLGVGDALAAVVGCALEKDRESRYENAEAMTRALRAARTGEVAPVVGPTAPDVGPTQLIEQTPTAPPDDPPPKPKPKPKPRAPTPPPAVKKPSKLPYVLLFLVLFAAGGAGAWWFTRKPAPAPPPDDGPVTVDLTFGTTPASLQPAITAAESGDQAAAATALAKALRDAADRPALIQAAQKEPALQLALKAPEVAELL